MACHTLMAFILYCAAKQMQIESRTCQACLGNYAEISCQREQSKTCLSYAECSRYSTKLNIVPTRAEQNLFELCRNIVPMSAEPNSFGLCRMQPIFNEVKCSFAYAKLQIFSQTNVKMLRLLLFLQQFNVFSRLSAILFINNRDN